MFDVHISNDVEIPLLCVILVDPSCNARKLGLAFFGCAGTWVQMDIDDDKIHSAICGAKPVRVWHAAINGMGRAVFSQESVGQIIGEGEFGGLVKDHGPLGARAPLVDGLPAARVFTRQGIGKALRAHGIEKRIGFYVFSVGRAIAVLAVVGRRHEFLDDDHIVLPDQLGEALVVLFFVQADEFDVERTDRDLVFLNRRLAAQEQQQNAG